MARDKLSNGNGHKAADLQPTSAEEWMRPYEEGVTIKLPSGNNATIRPVSISTYLAAGHIPNELLPIATAHFVTETQTAEVKTAEDYLNYVRLLDAFCKTCYVYPKVVDERKDPKTEILASAIDEADKIFLIGFLGSPAERLKSFRRFQEEPVGRVVDQPGESPVAEPTVEPESVGVGDPGDAG